MCDGDGVLRLRSSGRWGKQAMGVPEPALDPDELLDLGQGGGKEVVSGGDSLRGGGKEWGRQLWGRAPVVVAAMGRAAADEGEGEESRDEGRGLRLREPSALFFLRLFLFCR